MPFKERKIAVAKPIRATRFLNSLGYTNTQAQKILDKRRLYQNSRAINKSDVLESGYVVLVDFIPLDLGLEPVWVAPALKDGLRYFSIASGAKKYGLKPESAYARRLFKDSGVRIGENKEDSKNLDSSSTISTVSTMQTIKSFAIFNKPAKLLTHPKNQDKTPSLLDSIRFHFGMQANPCHRLDKDTSGLVLCSTDKESEVILKNLFSKNLVKKEYLAVVRGNISEGTVCGEKSSEGKNHSEMGNIFNKVSWGYKKTKNSKDNKKIENDKKSTKIESSIIFPKERFGNLCIKGKAQNLKVTEYKCEKILDSIANNHTKAITILTPLRYFANNLELRKFLDSTKIFDNVFCLESFNAGVLERKSFSQKYYSQESFKIDSKINNFFVHYMTQIATNDFNAFKAHSHKNIKNAGFTLVRLEPLTGRTHQLRIHTSSIGHPILGDTLYGVSDAISSFFLDIENMKIHSFIPQKVREILALQNLDSKMGDKTQEQKSQKDEDILHKILYFYHALKHKREEIKNLARVHFCGSDRLMLHANALHFLEKNFVDFKLK